MTNNAGNMWLGSLPENSFKIEIDIYLPENVITVGALKIWNYNKSLIDSGKGVKDMRIQYFKEKLIKDF